MTLSDSLPVQFWDIDEDTFNETSVCGLIKQDCFCQPFECDDEIVIQFLDDNAFHWSLFAFNTDQEQVGEFDFEEVANGVWQTTVTFDQSPCSQKLYFQIRKAESFEDSDFNDASGYDDYFSTSPLLAPVNKWFLITSGNGQWTHSQYGSDLAAYMYLTLVAVGTRTSLTLGHKFFQITPAFRTIAYSFRSGAWNKTFGDANFSSGSLIAVYYDSSGTQITTQTITSLSANTSYSGTFNTVISGFSYIGIRITVTTTAGSFFAGNTEFWVMLFSISGSLASEYVAKSDCIDLKESHDCTKLITYQNSSDFDGINYTNVSPDAGFKLRIPAIFFEEENPQEQEDLELSNGVIVTLRQSIVEKRKLETGFMPNYMHRKLQKILMHDSVYIDGDYWKKRDSYDTSPVKKYNLKTASVLLTKYDSVEKNTI